MLGMARRGRGRPDRRGGHRPCPPLRRRSAAGSSTSSGSAARACPPTRTSRRRSERRCAAGTCATRSSWARSRGSRSTSAASRRRLQGWEVVVSTAHLHRIEGMRRADFLAELVAAQPAIVVGGAHGKTTTAAMIAFVLQETGRDPAWIIGGIVPQLGGNAGVGDGWLVVEGDESDRSIGSLRPQIAVLTNIELDHHAAYASEAELRTFFDDWLAEVPHVVRSWELPPVELDLAVPGEHNRQNAAAALVGARAGRRAAGRGGGSARALHRRRSAARARRRARRRHGLRRLRPQPDRARGDAPHGAVADERPGDRRLPAARGRADAPAPPGARRRRSGSPTSRS